MILLRIILISFWILLTKLINESIPENKIIDWNFFLWTFYKQNIAKKTSEVGLTHEKSTQMEFSPPTFSDEASNYQ